MITKDMLAGVFLDSPELEAYLLLCSKNSEEVGVEKHHILPKSIFPQYAKQSWNIVKLTYADHYKVHAILPSLCATKEAKSKMLCAWNRIRNAGKVKVIDAESYSILRAEYSKYIADLMKGNKNCEGKIGNMTGKQHSAETKNKMSKSRKGVPKSEAHKQSMRDCQLGDKSPKFGVKWDEEGKAKLRIACAGELNGMYGKKHSEETKKKISAARLARTGVHGMQGKKHSEETKRKISETKLLRAALKKVQGL